MPTCDVQLSEGTEMSYLKEFQTRISNHDYPALLKLWEEYCASDVVDPEEFKLILSNIKASNMAESFGRHVDKAIPLWKTLTDSPNSNAVVKLILDLQTSNSPQLADLAFEYLKSQHGSDKDFN